MITGKEIPKPNSTEKQYDVAIDNGDLKLVDELVEAYGFKDRDSLIKFAIGTLLQGNNNEGLYTIKKDEMSERKILSKINPPQQMLKTKSE